MNEYVFVSAALHFCACAYIGKGIFTMCQNAPVGREAREGTRSLRVRAQVSAKNTSTASSKPVIPVAVVLTCAVANRLQLIEQLHGKLRDKMSEKLNDPFKLLPLEIATMVLQHFNFRQIV